MRRKREVRGRWEGTWMGRRVRIPLHWDNQKTSQRRVRSSLVKLAWDQDVLENSLSQPLSLAFLRFLGNTCNGTRGTFTLSTVAFLP